MDDKTGILHIHVYLLICLVQSPDKICQCMVTTVLNQRLIRASVYVLKYTFGFNKHVSKSKYQYQFDAFTIFESSMNDL